jgi:hypothetical protein
MHYFQAINSAINDLQRRQTTLHPPNPDRWTTSQFCDSEQPA